MCDVAPDFGITEELVTHLKKQEGLRLKVYRCQAGYPTIGWGHRVDSMEHPPITRERAEELLRADIRVKRAKLLELSPMLAQESERRAAALIDFCFNCGEGAYAQSTLRKRVEARNWEAAASENKRWVHAKGVRLPELVARRKITAAWLEEG